MEKENSIKYLPRIIENTLKKQLKAAGCVVIEGPKWCGKSTTAKRFAKTVVELQRKKVKEQYLLYLNHAEEKILEGEKPKLFDEWQNIKELWDLIRYDVDNNKGAGRFILTGSSVPVEDPDRHSGIGRMVKLVMRPMSLWESGESTGVVSISKLFEGEHTIPFVESRISFSQLAFLICRGGWPETLDKDEETALLLAENYHAALIEEDITKVDDIKRNPERASKVLYSYARNISSLATNQTIQLDCSESPRELIDDKTLSSYTNALRKLFVIEDTPPWAPHMRSKTAIRSSNKRQFVCPSIAVASLGANPESLMNDTNTMGLLFESLAIRDLRVYAQALGGKVYHYRDSGGLEVDAIIQLKNKDWAGIEIKLGNHQIEEGATNLKILAGKIDTTKTKPPRFLMVLTGHGSAYRRDDGIFVIPIGCLRD